MADNGAMNRMIAAAARRDTGLMDRVTAPLDNDRQERLNFQMAAYEDAVKRGDDVAAGVADTQIEKLLAEARAAQTPQEGQEPAPPTGSGFDGGVRTAFPVKDQTNMNGFIVRRIAERKALTAAARGD
jgi:hypothetical protein